jgi:dihydrofolate synthase / folylpolyglutamate synthase
MSRSFSSYRDVEDYLLSIPKFSTSGIAAADFNLDRMKQACSALSHPERKFPSIHVAGTNGKGTVCQMLASVYRAAGYRTGIYTSPHLTNLRERFRINGVLMPEEDLLRFFTENGDAVPAMNLTFFELTTLIAFWYFADQNVDLAVIETGLGGRLDATNVIDPVCSVITSVGMDHTDILGDTPQQIALEKAGIIKPGTPVVAGCLTDEVQSVIRREAESRKAVLTYAGERSPRYHNGQIRLEMEGRELVMNADGRKRIDAVNAAIAASVVTVLKPKFPVSAEKLQIGLESVDRVFPHHAHFEKLDIHRNWYFDGAHNPEAVAVLVEELLSRAPADQWIVVLSLMKDKLSPDLAQAWKPFSNLYLVAMDAERAATTEEMKSMMPWGIPVSSAETWIQNRAESTKSELVIFSGSFYFYEKIRRWMGTMAAENE